MHFCSNAAAGKNVGDEALGVAAAIILSVLSEYSRLLRAGSNVQICGMYVT